ncbi:hypothetical protein [uncultured Streptomyces sp.]|uniref:hypothetical protein n=1 Tax=uncultured Streptomyces sp. TaxID=174707 RepID=UPI00260A9187|nr:hypothetical protein [uncultured Streptomyces sp.]
MKPLLLIDVDGPLNPFAALARRRPPQGYRRHLMRPTGWEAGDPLPVLLNPEHGDELLTLTDRFELAWATTWKAEANRWIAPQLGLPALPHVEWPGLLGPGPDATYGKTQHVVAYADGRPFAWVDDEITDRDRAWVTVHHPARALLLTIDPRVGLVRRDFDTLAAWVADAGA